ncbi:MAG: hypothetical protein HGA78_02655 [Nitrospirales bacterium]|nr:hypothetical protein [Nitrospirales bacterium]
MNRFDVLGFQKRLNSDNAFVLLFQSDPKAALGEFGADITDQRADFINALLRIAEGTGEDEPSQESLREVEITIARDAAPEVLKAIADLVVAFREKP